MKKLLRLIIMACALVVIAGCSSDLDTVRETWRLTYDDYHVLVVPSGQTPPENLKITRDVDVLRTKNELSIKGIIAEYPDAWTKFTIQGDTLCCEQGQPLNESENPTIWNRNPVRFYWGSCYRTFYSGTSLRTQGIYFETNNGEGQLLMLSPDGNIIKFADRIGYAGAFWYKKIESEIIPDVDFYISWRTSDLVNDYTETGGTGYPDVGYMVNIVFRKMK